MAADLDETATRLRRGDACALDEEWGAPAAECAYSIQARCVQCWQDQGRRVVGAKVGLAPSAVRTLAGGEAPGFSVLFDDMRVEDGAVLPAIGLREPKAEAKIAFIVRKDLGRYDATAEQVDDAIDCALTAIEIVDSRIPRRETTLFDAVADNGSSALFVLGRAHKLLSEADLWSCGMVLEVNGAVAATGAGAACMGHPLNAVRWLARAMGSMGQQLLTGDVILTGALGPRVSLRRGDHVRATIGGLGAADFRYAA